MLARRCGVRYLLLWFQVSTAVALARLKRRARLKSEFLRKHHRPLSATVMFRIAREIEEPLIREPYVVVDSTTNYRGQARAVAAL